MLLGFFYDLSERFMEKIYVNMKNIKNKFYDFFFEDFLKNLDISVKISSTNLNFFSYS